MIQTVQQTLTIQSVIMIIEITEEERERLISAIKCSNLPDKVVLWNLHNKLESGKSFRCFKLTEQQEEKCKSIDGYKSYIFTPTGIGTKVKIKLLDTGKEFDITDYDTW